MLKREGMTAADFAAMMRSHHPNVETSSEGFAGEIIDDMFEYHQWTSEKVAAGAKVRAALAEAVKVIIDNVPPSADRSTAIRKIREARMDANSAITHDGRY